MSQRNALLAAILLTLVFVIGAIALQTLATDPEPDTAVAAPQVTTLESGGAGGDDAWDDENERDDEGRQTLSTYVGDDEDGDDDHDDYHEDNDDHND